jgi:hypothetical protein
MSQKMVVKREEIERAYLELTKCPCCGYKGFDSHSCGCSPEVYQNRIQEIEVEGELKTAK